VSLTLVAASAQPAIRSRLSKVQVRSMVAGWPAAAVRSMVRLPAPSRL